MQVSLYFISSITKTDEHLFYWSNVQYEWHLHFQQKSKMGRIAHQLD